MTKVILLRNPRALLVPDVAMLIKRAVEGTDHVAPGGVDTTAKEFFDYTTDADKFLFLGIEDGDSKGLVMGYFPDSALFPLPMVTLIYNEGTKALSKRMQEAVVEHISAHGHGKFWAMNATDKPDAVWIRALTPKGVKGHKIATVIEMAIQ